MGIKVRLHEILEALEQPEGWHSWLDPRTGKVVTITDEEADYLDTADEEDLAHLADWQRESVIETRRALEGGALLDLPDRFDVHEWEIMRQFSLSRPDDEREALLDAIHGSGAFRMFRATTERLGVRDAWYSWRDDALRRIAIDWLEEHGIEFQEEPSRSEVDIPASPTPPVGSGRIQDATTTDRLQRGTAREEGAPMTVELRRRRFTVDDYYGMARAGILTEDDRVELIEGEILDMAAIGSRHAGVVNRLTRILVRQAGDDAVVTVQNPVRLSDLSEPQPDLALLRPRPDSYTGAHPLPPDVLLIVEVAHTTLGFDREVKLPLYATAGVPEVWLVDVEGGAIDVHRAPERGHYTEMRRVGPGGTVRPTLLPTIDVEVGAVLA